MMLRFTLAVALAFGAATGPMAIGADAAIAPAKKKSHKRTDFTPAQRDKMMEEARNICRKKYGAGARVYQLDYYHWKVWCMEG